MALSGTINGSTSNSNVKSKITWSATQSVSGNYSDVTAILYYYRNDTGYTTAGTWSGKITINGTNTTGSKYISVSYNSNTKTLTAKTRVYHDSDGSKSITISASGAISGTSVSSTSCSALVSLTTIPRASTISSVTSSVTAGNNVTVKVSRKVSSFYHKARFKMNGNTKANSSAFATSLSYTVPLGWLTEIPNSKTGTVTVEVRTYTNSSCTTQVGSVVSKTFTIAAPAAVGPTLDTDYITVECYNTGTAAAGINAYLKGYSRAKVTFGEGSTTTQLGATITRYEVEYDGSIDSSSPYLTKKFASAGTKTVICRVYDSRGFSDYKELEVYVYDYSKPTLSSITLRRSDSTGTADPEGTYLYGKATLNYSSAGGAVGCTLKGYFRTASGAYGTGVNMTSGTGTFISSSLSPTVFYYAKIEAIDSLGAKATHETVIKTKSKGLNLKRGGKGAAFFGYSSNDGELTVYGNVNALEGVLKGKSAEIGTDGLSVTGPVTIQGAEMKKTLLSGANWSLGNQSVTDISKYTLVLIKLAGESTLIPCVISNGYLRGGTSWVNASNNIITYSVSATISGDVLTYVNSGYMQHTASNTHGAWTQVAVESIIGIL